MCVIGTDPFWEVVTCDSSCVFEISSTVSHSTDTPVRTQLLSESNDAKHEILRFHHNRSKW